MTLAQIFVYWMEAKDPGSTVACKPHELNTLQAKIKYQRDQWEANAMREVSRGL